MPVRYGAECPAVHDGARPTREISEAPTPQ